MNFSEHKACRGDKHDDAVTPMDVMDSQMVNEVVVDAGALCTLPAGADFLMCYSVAEGQCLVFVCVLCFTKIGVLFRTGLNAIPRFYSYVTKQSLKLFSSCKGYYSHRETVNGSWYIQDLCEILRHYGSTLEFTDILTLVNRKVSIRSVENCKDRSALGKKQVPCFASMLTKKLFFRPKQ